MPMPKEQIDAAIDERLADRWRKRCHEESAAPVAVIAVKQLDGPDFGQPVVCDLDDQMLADLLIGIANLLRRGRRSGTAERFVVESD